MLQRFGEISEQRSFRCWMQESETVLPIRCNGADLVSIGTKFLSQVVL